MSLESNIEKLVGVATLPLSLIYALWNIGIFLHKQATHTKHFDGHWIRNKNIHKKTHINVQHINDLVILLFRGSERIGEYQYVGDDGKLYTVRYSAGVNGFRILSGDHIPSGKNSDQRNQMALKFFSEILSEFFKNALWIVLSFCCSLRIFTIRNC